MSDVSSVAVARPGLRMLCGSVLMRMFSGVTRQVQKMRTSQHALLGTPPQRMVFLGDSITDWGLWSEWFPDADVLNRGVAGDTSADVLQRLDSCLHEPRAVFLMVGTNDISQLIPLETIARNVDAIMTRIERQAPGTPIFVSSVMPRAAHYQNHIQALNVALRAVVNAHAAVTFIDVWSAMVDARGALRAEMTEDGIHLSGAGYAAWVEKLRPHVDAMAREAR